MNIDEKTRLFLSVSSKPGRFGATIYNGLFRRYGMNAVYVPRPAPATAEHLLQALHSLKVSGCSVSMPLKSAVVPWLDGLDPIAEQTNSVNTIVPRDDRLIGYNTDVHGVHEALRGVPCTSVLIFGAGGVVGSLVRALRRHGATEIALTARRPERARKTARRWSLRTLEDSTTTRNGNRFDLFINATPASAEPRTCQPLLDWVPRARAICDLALTPHDTPLIAKARHLQRKVVTGADIHKHQLRKQFHLYTGQETSLEAIENCLASARDEQEQSAES